MLEITVISLAGPIGFFTTLWAITEIHSRVTVFFFDEGRLADLEVACRRSLVRGRHVLDEIPAPFLHGVAGSLAVLATVAVLGTTLSIVSPVDRPAMADSGPLSGHSLPTR